MFKIFFIILLLIPLAGKTQEQKWGIQLQSYLSNADNEEMLDVFLRGDVEKIKEYTLRNGGWVKLQSGNSVSVSLPVYAFANLKTAVFLDFIEFSLYKGRPMNDVMLGNNNVIPVHQGAGALPAAYTGEGVIMGFIDTGIELAHPDFQNPDGSTRVLALWDQTQDETQINRIPEPYGYGQEWNAEDIDAGISNHDDQATYYGHGSTVTGAAAGNAMATGEYKGVAPDAHLIIVSSDFDRPNWKSSVADAVDYIFKRADDLNMPAVINASLGDYLGSHDGLDAAALFIDSLLEAKEGRVMVSAAGNSGNMGNYHLSYEITPEDTSFTWFSYNPNSILDEGAVYFELWADTADFEQVQYSIGADVISPEYSFRGYVPFRNAEENLNNLIIDTLVYNNQIIGITETWLGLRGGQYYLEVKVTQPFSSQYRYRFATTGTGIFDIWSKASFGTSEIISTDLPDSGQFPDIVNYKLPDNAKTIVDSWNCSPKVITVANYTNRNQYTDVNGNLVTRPEVPGTISINSSRGPARGGEQKPDIAASGDNTLSSGRISTLNSMINSEPHKVAQGGMHYINGGTSMASPVVAGIAALYLSRCPGANYQSIKDAIVSSGTQDAFTGDLPSFRWGAGKVNAFATLLSTVNPVITDPAGSSSFCEGDLLEIAAINTFSNYVWSNGVPGSNLIINEAGDYFVSAIDEDACLQLSETVHIEMLPAPAQPLIGFINDSLFSTEAFAYQWYKNGVALTGANEIYFIPIEAGLYQVEVFDSLGCSSFSEEILLPVTGINEQIKTGFSIYPNPATDQITLKINCVNCFDYLRLIDVNGRIIVQEKFPAGIPNEFTWNVNSIPSGIYLIEASGQKLFSRQKLLIAK